MAWKQGSQNGKPVAFRWEQFSHSSFPPGIYLNINTMSSSLTMGYRPGEWENLKAYCIKKKKKKAYCIVVDKDDCGELTLFPEWLLLPTCHGHRIPLLTYLVGQKAECQSQRWACLLHSHSLHSPSEPYNNPQERAWQYGVSLGSVFPG